MIAYAPGPMTELNARTLPFILLPVAAAKPLRQRDPTAVPGCTIDHAPAAG